VCRYSPPAPEVGAVRLRNIGAGLLRLGHEVAYYSVWNVTARGAEIPQGAAFYGSSRSRRPGRLVRAALRLPGFRQIGGQIRVREQTSFSAGLKPAMEFLRPDRVLVSVPDFEEGLSALREAAEAGLPTILDMRDPWYYSGMTPGVAEKSDLLERAKELVSLAHKRVTVSRALADHLTEHHNCHFESVTNGIDHSVDLRSFTNSESLAAEGDYPLFYSGLLYAGRRTLDPILIAMKRSPGLGPLLYVGPSQRLVLSNAQTLGILDRVTAIPSVSRSDLPALIDSARTCISVVADSNADKGSLLGTIPGKTFEYVSRGKRVLGVGDPRGALADFLQAANAGICVRGEDTSAIVHAVGRLARATEPFSSQVEDYHWKRLGQNYAEIIVAPMKDQATG